MHGAATLNNAGTTLTSTLGSGVAAPTSATVNDASIFAGATLPIYLVRAPQAETESSPIEIFEVSAIVSNTLTISARAIGGTVAATWAIGDKIEFRLTGDQIDELQTEIAALSAGSTGARAANFFNFNESLQ